MSKKIIRLAACATIVASWATVAWMRHDIPADQPVVAASTLAALPATTSRPLDAIARTNATPAAQLQSQYEHFMTHRPPYLADVDLPGRYAVDADGNLIIDAGIKDMLDFFFLAVGDLSFEQIHDLIAGSMIAALQEPARSQALAFLDRYFTYVDAYDQWQQSFDKDASMASDGGDMQQHLAELEALRRQQLGDIAYEAFFAEGDQVNAAYLQAQTAMKQANLSEAEKADIREQLQQALPPKVRQAQEAAMTLVNLTQKTAQLQQQGASADEVFQARAAMVGEAAATRLAQVDDEERAWTQKRDQYQRLAHATPELESMTGEERQNHLAALARSELGLNDGEVRRMQALDRIDADSSLH